MFEWLFGKKKVKALKRHPAVGEVWKMDMSIFDEPADPWPTPARAGDVVIVIRDVKEGWVRYAMRMENNVHKAHSTVCQDERKPVGDFIQIYKFYRDLVDFPVESA